MVPKLIKFPILAYENFSDLLEQLLSPSELTQ